ncbi:putative ripening-related protein 1 [Tanacetum coccineum]
MSAPFLLSLGVRLLRLLFYLLLLSGGLSADRDGEFNRPSSSSCVRNHGFPDLICAKLEFRNKDWGSLNVLRFWAFLDKRESNDDSNGFDYRFFKEAFNLKMRPNCIHHLPVYQLNYCLHDARATTLFMPSVYAQSKSGGRLKGGNATLLDSGNTDAIMTFSSFEKGGDGGAPSECDGQYHSNTDPIVALSTQWYNNGQRCFNYINIYYKDNSVRAMVVDECDSNSGCRDNIVVASYAVWIILQVPGSDWGETSITWSDA